MAAESTKNKSKDTKTDSSAKGSKLASATSDGKAGADGGGDASGDAPANYSRGEAQKVVSKRYLRNWDNVFGQKRRPAK